jgi:hypothetical protein
MGQTRQGVNPGVERTRLVRDQSNLTVCTEFRVRYAVWAARAALHEFLVVRVKAVRFDDACGMDKVPFTAMRGWR